MEVQSSGGPAWDLGRIKPPLVRRDYGQSQAPLGRNRRREPRSDSGLRSIRHAGRKCWCQSVSNRIEHRREKRLDARNRTSRRTAGGLSCSTACPGPPRDWPTQGLASRRITNECSDRRTRGEDSSRRWGSVQRTRRSLADVERNGCRPEGRGPANRRTSRNDFPVAGPPTLPS